MREKLIEKLCMCDRDRQTEEISKTINIIFNDFHILPFYPPVDEHITRNRVGDGSNRLCSQIKKRKGTGRSIGH